jgi:hypothetical protein
MCSLRASAIADRVKKGSKSLLAGYALATGQLLELQHDLVGSERAYHGAMQMEPFDAQPGKQLALLLAREGRTIEANADEDKGLALFPPDQRPRRERYFEHVLLHSKSRTSTPPTARR